ncbi:ubiquitin-protein ligase peroxin 2 SCDLUD_004053 [Saccharomycodes ludwigii]|uniref:ubiquitin-protein ligase peroxin 2 n=1 Tax=Saccharomycodes ludwigii TaxID=36035 RepID=UPI001E8B1067|nr:hypothetical protein SCDLUD_004053 [Saccharomycodes ludwigii]KAH3899765.1 hypothetical protein SCDLUD_004053 [Saccharomycodes ludwigii]
MSISVNKIDTLSMDNAIYDKLESLFYNSIYNIPVRCNNNIIDECKLLLKTVIYYFTTTSTTENSISTSGSEMCGVEFTNSSKWKLYCSMILSTYSIRKLSKCYYNSNTSSSSVITITTHKLIKLLLTIFKIIDFSNFVKLISVKNYAYLTIYDRIFGIQCKVNTSKQDFYDMIALYSLDFQSTQFLLDNIMELFSTDLISDVLVKFIKKRQYSTTKKTITTSKTTTTCVTCLLCMDVPFNACRVECCKSQYCYYCVCKVLEWGVCTNCSSVDVYIEQIEAV